MDRAKFIRLLAISIVASLAASCGGGGGGGPGTPDGGTPATAASKIFVGDSANAAIGSSADSNPAAGTLVVNRVIVGPNTELDTNLSDFALDVPGDRVYVADLRKLLAFNNASTATGNVAPRIVSTIPVGSSYAGVSLDTAGNRLYAGTNVVGANQSVQVFDNASTASLAAPTRLITFATSFIFDIAVDTAKDILYVYGRDAGGFHQILSFNNASTLNAPVVPDRTISFGDSGGGGPVGIFIDPVNDRLYVPRNGGTIAVFNAASTVTGSVTTTAVPARTITVSTGFTVVFVELTADRLYTLDPLGINVIPNASTVNGAPPPFVRALAPAGSVFRALVVKP